MPFYRATNTGVGFITHEDRELFEVANVANDLYEVSGNFQAWVARVGAKAVAPETATREIRKATITGQLMMVDNPAFASMPNALTPEQIAALRAELANLG